MLEFRDRDERRKLGQEIEAGTVAREPFTNRLWFETKAFGGMDVVEAGLRPFGPHVLVHRDPCLVAKLHAKGAISFGDRSDWILAQVRRSNVRNPPRGEAVHRSDRRFEQPRHIAIG